MKFKPAMTLLVCLLVASSAVAQFTQDPLDQGEADTVRMIVSLMPDAVTNQLDVQVDLYVSTDVQTVTSVSLGFFWVNSNLQMTEGYFTPEGASAFDFIQFIYRNNSIDKTNEYQEFQCVGGRMFGPGVPPGPDPLHVASYEFTLSSWTVMDSLVLDTVQVLGAGFAFVDQSNNEYRPFWVGRIVIYDQNRPILSNLVLTDDTLYYHSIEGQDNPPMQTIEVLSDREPLAFDLNEDISWLLKSPSSGVTPQEVEFSVTTTGLIADTYFDSVEVVSSGAANSPQYLFVELDLAPPLPVIDVDHEAFYFNALAGGDNPSDQTLNITNAGQSVLNWSVTNNENWLSLAPTSGSGPGTVTLSVTTAGLTFGEYHDTVVVSDPAATNSPVRIPVRLSVASDLPVIEVDSVVNYWSIDWDAEGPMFTRSFGVRNGGAGDLNFWVEKDEGYIINITPASSTAPDSITLLFYMPNPPDFTSLVPLTVLENIRVLSNGAINSPVNVECWFRFPLVPSVLHVEPTTIEFDVYECSQGWGQPMPSQELTVANLGGDEPMTVDIIYESELFVVEGLEPAQDAPATYTVTSLRPDLSFGTYVDTIWVTSQWASNKPQLVEVTLNYLPASMPPVIALSGGNLAFPYQAESGPQIYDILTIGNLNPGCMGWEIVENVDWLTPVVTEGGVPDASPLLVDPVGYALGEYTGSLEIIAPSAINSPAEVGLTLQVWTLRGDVNWNGRITAQDIALLIDYVFEGEHPPQPAELVADVNCDDVVDVADLALMIEYLFETLEPLCGNPY